MQTEISIMDLLGIARKFIVILLVVTLLAGAVGFAVTEFLIDPLYTAEASMYVYSDSEGGNTTSSEIAYAKSMVKTYSVVITSDTVLQKVVDTLKPTYPDLTLKAVKKMVIVEPISDTEAFMVTVTNADRFLATDLCNAITEIAPEEVIRVVKRETFRLLTQQRSPRRQITLC